VFQFSWILSLASVCKSLHNVSVVLSVVFLFSQLQYFDEESESLVGVGF